MIEWRESSKAPPQTKPRLHHFWEFGEQAVMAAATAYQWASMPKILFHFYVSHVFFLNHLAAVNILCYFIHFLSPKCPLDYCIIIIDYRMTRQRTMATPLKYAVGWLDFFSF